MVIAVVAQSGVPACYDASMGGAIIAILQFASGHPARFLEIVLPILALCLAILVVTAILIGKISVDPLRQSARGYLKHRARRKLDAKKLARRQK